MKLRPMNLIIQWLAIVLISSSLGMVIRLALYNVGWGHIDFSPWGDLPGMIVISVFGWIIFGVVGPLWLILFSLVITLWKKKSVDKLSSGQISFSYWSEQQLNLDEDDLLKFINSGFDHKSIKLKGNGPVKNAEKYMERWYYLKKFVHRPAMRRSKKLYSIKD